MHISIVVMHFYFLIGGKLLYNVVILHNNAKGQNYTYIDSLLILPPLPLIPPLALDHRRTPGWAPCVTQQLLSGRSSSHWLLEGGSAYTKAGSTFTQQLSILHVVVYICLCYFLICPTLCFTILTSWIIYFLSINNLFFNV